MQSHKPLKNSISTSTDLIFALKWNIDGLSIVYLFLYSQAQDVVVSKS